MPSLQDALFRSSFRVSAEEEQQLLLANRLLLEEAGFDGILIIAERCRSLKIHSLSSACAFPLGPQNSLLNIPSRSMRCEGNKEASKDTALAC